ncbi:MAG: family 10 glycosylhydrolase [Anaerolineae bacterium]
MRLRVFFVFLVGVLLLAGPVVAQADLTLYFYRDGGAVPVAREGVLSGEPRDDAISLLTALLAGPTPAERAAGLTSPLPPGAALLDVTVEGQAVTVDLDLPLDFLRSVLDPGRADAIVEQVVKTLHRLDLHRVTLRAADEAGSLLPLSAFLPPVRVPVPAIPANDEPLPDRPGPAPDQAGQPPAQGQGRPAGPLSGKTVWLSAGHGWYWSDSLNRWTTQRGNNYGLVEDFSDAEAVNYYLARYLWNAGADVWLVRERSMIGHEVVVDNDDGAPAYVESGSWLTSGTPGYEDGTYRWASTFDAPSATATWTPDLPQAGWYAVWAWYRHGANRPTDARYQVHHAGGVTPVSISQEVHGQTWRYLGDYYFEAGTDGHVTLLNASDDTSQAVIADAVRFGGGPGSIEEPGGTSGRPRWEEAAKYWARFQGAPPEVYEYDVTARPLYAEWEAAKGYPGEAEAAVYISWHTNAGGATGSESYVHVTEPTTGSLELQDEVHAELIHDLRAAWDPAWVNRGQKAADFGELRELSTMPGILLEVAFHDTEDPGDADDLREPLFRQIAARAVYQGIVKYHAARQGDPVHLLPEPPRRLVARTTAPGRVTLSWAPPPCCDGVLGDAATGYKVYHSTGGRAFDGGVETGSPSLVVDGLAPGSLHFFRVTALNDGGESFPTPVVAVALPLSGQAPTFLLVDGFDRLDQEAMIAQWEAPFLGTAQRMFLERMNSYDYAVEHGQALAACGLAFDGADDEAVAAGDLSLADYPALDWFAGEDSAADASLGDAERLLLAAYLDGGGRLLLSGAEVGYDLVENGRDPAFFHDYLRAAYQGDDADTYAFAGLPGGPFEGLAGTFGDGSGRSYDVGYPDRLGPALDASLVLTYTGGSGGGAAVAYGGGGSPGQPRAIYAGFPLESVVDAGLRRDLICAAAGYLVETAAAPLGAQRLINPGFEGGTAQSAWQVAAPASAPVLAHRDDLPAGPPPASGDWLAWMGGYGSGLTTTVALTQVVALPSGEPTVTLALSWFVRPAGTLAAGAETFSLAVADLSGTIHTRLLTLTAASPAGAWRTDHFDLGGLAGQTVQVSLRAVARDTAFFVDDLSLVTAGPRGPDEFRALWVDAYHPGIKSRQEIDELVETAQAGSFNALVVQVRRRGDTYYPSALDPWAPDADPGFDALGYLIQRAHAAGLEVHAWATTLAIWGGDTPPTAPDHVFNRQGPDAEGRDYWLMTDYVGDEQPGGQLYYLDPGHPDAVDYTVAIYAELAANYDLDGLHLDRIRYPEQMGAYCEGQIWYCQDWGYNPTSLARFQAQTGRDDVPLPLDPQWVDWRRDQVTALVRKIYLAATRADPHLRLSAALVTSGVAPLDELSWETRTPYLHHLQDWRGWLEEGILDLAMPMTYRDEDTGATQFTAWIEWQKDHQYGRGTVVGTGLYLNAVADSMDQWLRVRQPSGQGNQVRGLAGYSYATPSDGATPSRDFANTAVSQVLTRSASLPALPWKDAPLLGHLSGSLAPPLPCRDLDGYAVALSGPLSRTLHADGSGWFGAVDLPPGDYLLSVEVYTSGLTLQRPISVTAGAVTQAEIVLPPCGGYHFYLPLLLKQWPAGP